MSRRLCFLAIAVLLPLSTVYGADLGQNSKVGNIGSTSHLQQNSTTLNYWAEKSPSDPQELVDLINSTVKDFEGQNAGVTVNVTFEDPANLVNDLKKAVANGTPPDVVDTGARFVPQFVSLGYIQPLDSYVTADFRNKFIPAIINQGAFYQGRIFGLPIRTSTRAMYYNQDLFKAAGIDAAPKTWDDLLADGQKINALNQGAYGFGLQGGGGPETNTYFYYFVWGNGGDLYNQSNTASALNSAASVEALTFMHTLITQNATQPNVTSQDYFRRKGVEDLFVAGKLGMVISGSWLAPRLHKEAASLNFGIAPIPYHTTPATYGVMDAQVMLKTSQQKDLAWSFIQFEYDPTRRAAYAKAAGILPELTDVAGLPDFQQNKDFAPFLALLPSARFEPLNINSDSIATTVIKAVQDVYQGNAEPQAALDSAATDINKLLSAPGAGW